MIMMIKVCQEMRSSVEVKGFSSGLDKLPSLYLLVYCSVRSAPVACTYQSANQAGSMKGHDMIAALTLLILSPLAGVQGQEHKTQDVQPDHRPTVVACAWEDGSGQKVCVWDAKHQGNGSGQSLLIVNGGTDRALYLPIRHRLAHRLTH